MSKSLASNPPGRQVETVIYQAIYAAMVITCRDRPAASVLCTDSRVVPASLAETSRGDSYDENLLCRNTIGMGTRSESETQENSVCSGITALEYGQRLAHSPERDCGIPCLVAKQQSTPGQWCALGGAKSEWPVSSESEGLKNLMRTTVVH